MTNTFTNSNSSIPKKRTLTRKQKIIVLTLLNILLVTSITIITLVYGKVFYYEIKYAWNSVFNDSVKNSQKYFASLPVNVATTSEFLDKPLVTISNPKDKNFSVIIPKLGINQKVIADVDMTDEKQVDNALKEGIGWAKGTVEPGAEGNSLLFSHSTQNAWDIWRYNSEFTLLRKLEINDVFTVVYQERQYDFIIFEKKIVPANDTSYLTNVAEGRVVTLQTCHPPGSDKERLLIRGRLVARESK